MIDRRIQISLAGLIGLEIDGQDAIVDVRMARQILNVPAGDRINAVVHVRRLVQSMTLLLIARHASRSDPVEGIEAEDGRVIRCCSGLHGNLLVLFSPTGIAVCALRGHIVGSMKTRGIVPDDDLASLCGATRFRVCERP
jgi:hypothetical protein